MADGWLVTIDNPLTHQNFTDPGFLQKMDHKTTQIIVLKWVFGFKYNKTVAYEIKRY